MIALIIFAAAALAAILAYKQGRFWPGWMILGACLPLIALLFLAVLGPTDDERRRRARLGS